MQSGEEVRKKYEHKTVFEARKSWEDAHFEKIFRDNAEWQLVNVLRWAGSEDNTCYRFFFMREVL